MFISFKAVFIGKAWAKYYLSVVQNFIIRRYLETFPGGGFWKGKNFVFDERGSMNIRDPQKSEVVGRCCSCKCPYDTYDGATVCTVCREPVLCCEACRKTLDYVYYCEDHTHLTGIYYTYIDHFDLHELKRQSQKLRERYNQEQSRNKRRTIQKQIAKLQKREKELEIDGTRPSPRLQIPPCRTCEKMECTGECWGFHGTR
eukprot:gb/GECG01014294.1/.p1 GENE.gb/GECG01014294.1/~~gb/GECG01014294.1/.p1  ORF type:complete len:201 (+),score=12.03 gb/GECG01014294.1/:1-603(+)